ncbi:MAG: hypothetical protein N2595_02485 [bacterium]|nr:hypothetical protein [bacterium]
MADTDAINPFDLFDHEPDTDWRGRPLSESPKRCDRCGKYARMAIVEDAPHQPSRVQRFLLAIFAPEATELNRTYECPRCGYRIRDLSFGEAVLAPIVIIAAMILSLVAFLLFVFFVAST